MSNVEHLVVQGQEYRGRRMERREGSCEMHYDWTLEIFAASGNPSFVPRLISNLLFHSQIISIIGQYIIALTHHIRTLKHDYGLKHQS